MVFHKTGKEKRAGEDGKGREDPAFSLFPSSLGRLLFFDRCYFSLGYRAGSSAEERGHI